jgi:hypothetical protein
VSVEVTKNKATKKRVSCQHRQSERRQGKQKGSKPASKKSNKAPTHPAGRLSADLVGMWKRRTGGQSNLATQHLAGCSSRQADEAMQHFAGQAGKVTQQL